MTPRETILAIEQELNAAFLERREITRGMMVAMLAGEHVLLLGVPGSAKSAIVRDLCNRLQGSYFEWLLTKFSKPEELFGPISLKALENDSYRRITKGKLPEAEIAFLDEIFKANSAILNALLRVLNERLYDNDGTATRVPLLTCVGASNEMPEGEELAALFDRFMVRYNVAWIRDPRNFEALLAGADRAPATYTGFSKADLIAAQSEVAKVDVAKIRPQLLTLWQTIRQKNIPISDRRWKSCLKLLKAHAWLEGRSAAQDDDLEALAPALWTEPGQINEVRAVIMQLANPLNQEAVALLDDAMEQVQIATNAKPEEQVKAGMETLSKLRFAGKKLADLKSKAQTMGKSDARITEALEQVTGWAEEVTAKCLKI